MYLLSIVMLTLHFLKLPDHPEKKDMVNVLNFRELFSFCLPGYIYISAGIHKIFHVRIVNREGPDQTASKLGLHCLSIPF